MVRKHLRYLVGVLAVLNPSVLGKPLDAQQRITASDTAPCRTCTVLLEAVVTIRADQGDSATPLTYSRVAADGRGNILVSPVAAGLRIAVFDKDGNWLRSAGPDGLGEGEFDDLVELAVGPGDTVHVVDDRRYTKLLPGLVAPVATVQLAVPAWQIVPVSDGVLAVQYPIQTDSGAIALVHLLDSTGAISRSIVGQTLEGRLDNPATVARNLARSRHSNLWIGRVNTYSVELWSLDGARRAVVERNADWFLGWRQFNPLQPFRALPHCTIAGMWEDEGGLLWILGRVPDPAWKPVDINPGEVPDLDPVFDTVLEVLDPTTGALVAQGRFDQAVRSFIGQGLLYSVAVDAHGKPVLVIWRAELREYGR